MTLERYQQHQPIVHRTAFVHPSAQLIGEVSIGDEASVWPTCVLRGDNGAIVLGARTNLQDASVIHATLGVSTTTVGADCTIGHRVILHGCRIGDRCLVGMGSILLDGVELADQCFVAAGSLLTPGKQFPPRSFIRGSPAVRVREVNEKDLAAIAHGAAVYVELARQYRSAATAAP